MKKPNFSNTKLILIAGKRYSGKDTFAILLKDLLIEKGCRVDLVSTAQHLKTEYCMERNLDLGKFLNDRLYKESYREDFSKYVLEHSEEENFQIFLNELENKLELDFVIISDVRSKYDLIELKSRFDCFSICIKSSDEEKIKRGWLKSKYDDSHFENQLDKNLFDLVVENNSSILDLKLKIEMIINSFLGKGSIERK
ncbi:hypothetical protein H0W91_01715 [Patescibacteria group bacterium]|nr:hypothetical protein [Patescibacteria group bacterium]